MFSDSKRGKIELTGNTTHMNIATVAVQVYRGDRTLNGFKSVEVGFGVTEDEVQPATTDRGIDRPRVGKVGPGEH